MDHHHVGTGCAPAQGRAGIGVLEALDRGLHYQLDVVSVVPPQDGHAVQPLLGQLLTAPLGQPVAGDGGAVAELGGQRLHKALTADIVVEDIVHQSVDIVKDVAAFDELLVRGGGGGDLEGIAAADVVFGVDPVQGEGDLRQNIGAERRELPGGIDLAGGYIFDVVGEGDGDVFRALAGGAQVYGDKFGDIGDDNRRHVILLYRGCGVTATVLVISAGSGCSGRGISSAS